uniref:Heterogeneous nuclear ribonucleoprotein M isoform X2 n=1 Tax=Geotrypetes seraphini TaxID=260995 RepID=A0A6P8S5R0_GEOSA|nr:heterogeneous nuclear ribonucleoprotein M isoform X2 [Geotrypetes seraphini]
MATEAEGSMDDNASNGGAAPGSETDSKGNDDRSFQNDRRKERGFKKGGNRFEPYFHPMRRYRAFLSNIPFDVRWQSLKDLVKEKVGEVTYVELLMDAEGKSRGCAVVEFKQEDNMRKAAEVLNKYMLNGRPLKAKEDPDGEHARRAVQKMINSMGGPGPMGFMGPGPMGPMGPMGGPGPMGRPMGMGPGPGPLGPGVNIPPSILNNPNIPNEVIHALQTGRLGSTVFIANLDYKVTWKKLKEVFNMAGAVVRADILEDKEGKSRGIGTVTYEQAIEAVQAISMFHGQSLFDRPMLVKIDDKSLPKGDGFPPDRPPQLPRGLGGIGMGLGPGGQPIDANQLSRGIGMGPPELERGMGGFERDFSRGDISMTRAFGDALDRGIGTASSTMAAIDRLGTGMGSGIDRLTSNMSRGIDRVGPDIDRMSLVMDRMGSGVDRIGTGIDRMSSMSMDPLPTNIDRVGQNLDRMTSNMDRMTSGMGYGMDRMGSSLDRVSSTMDRMGTGVDRMGAGIDRMGVGLDRMVSSAMDRLGSGMGQVMDRMPAGMDRMGSGTMDRIGLDHISASTLDRMGTGLGQTMGTSLDRMGLGVGANFDRTMDMERGNFGVGYGAAYGGAGTQAAGHTAATVRKGCQIFVRNLPFDFTWKMLKDKFNECGHVMYADIKLENGKSKGCGVVRFDSPQVAERACRMMNGIKVNGREIDVRMDRNA